MEILIIGNPVAGNGKAADRINRFVRILEDRGHEVETFLTRKPGDALSRASCIDIAPEQLVVAGGDGTINEVLNGLADPSRVPILHLPVGTANMLARDLGLPRGLKHLASVLERGKIRRVDMGLAGDRRFLLLLSAGFDAAVTEQVKHSRGKKLGYLGYCIPIMRTLTRHQPVELTVTIDDGESFAGQEIMVLNCRNYGGYFVFADDARLDSGHFDITVFPDGRITSLFRCAIAGLTRQVSKLPGVRQIKGKRIRIESRVPVPVQMDGDYHGTTPVEVEIRPAAVPVIVP
jgi:diacylglycerol kinase (ATP)